MKSATAILFICVIAFASPLKAQDQTAPPNHEEIKAKLGWMIGTWESEEVDGERRQFECKWILDNQFIRGTVAVGEPLEEFLHVLIGWNPVDKKLTVAGFSRRGSQSTGEYIKSVGGETHFALSGVEPEGRHSLILVYAHTNDDQLIVEYRDWIVGGGKKEPLKIKFTRKNK